MLNTPQSTPQAAPPVAPSFAPPEAGAQRLDVLFRHVLQLQAGRHLRQLVLQYRQEASP